MAERRRLFAADVAKEARLAPNTIRRLADEGKIPSGTDYRGWRVFNKESIKVAKQLAWGKLANLDGEQL